MMFRVVKGMRHALGFGCLVALSTILSSCGSKDSKKTGYFFGPNEWSMVMAVLATRTPADASLTPALVNSTEHLEASTSGDSISPDGRLVLRSIVGEPLGAGTVSFGEQIELRHGFDLTLSHAGYAQ